MNLIEILVKHINFKHKLLPLLVLVLLIIKCDTKKIELDKKLTTEASIKKEAEKILENKAETYISSHKNLSIINKYFEIRDLDKDSIMDVILFICLENTEDKSFKGTEIVFLKNNKKKLTIKDSSFYARKHITPNKQRNIYNKNKNFLSTYELLADPYGNLNHSSTREANITYFDNIYYDYTSDNKNFENYYESISDVYFNISFKRYRQIGVTKYCIAKNGLLARNSPTKRGNVKFKIDYGAQVNVIGITDQKAIVFDTDLNKQIEGNWVYITVLKTISTNNIDEDNSLNNTCLGGYVFNGYLDSNNEVY